MTSRSRLSSEDTCQSSTDREFSHVLMHIRVNIRGTEEMSCDSLASNGYTRLPEVSQAVAADWLSRPACPAMRRFVEESPGFKEQGGG